MTTVQIIGSLLLGVGLLVLALILYSFIRTAAGTRYSPVFYDIDRFHQPGQFVKRQYRGIFHLLFRLSDTVRYLYPLLRIFIFRSLSPAFREKILLTTAISNSCPQ